MLFTSKMLWLPSILISLTLVQGGFSLHSLNNDFEDRLYVLENRVAVLSSRILTLEYAFKELSHPSTPPSQQQSNKVFLPPEDAKPMGVSTSVDEDFRPRDCSQIKEELDPKQRHSTFYTIYPISRYRPLEVFCDMDSFGGGWTIVQRRGFEGNHREDFNRTWKEYEKGFGTMNGDFWLGLDYLAALTKYDDQSVLYELLTVKNGKRTIQTLSYDKFMVDTAKDQYRLHLAGFIEKYSTSPTFYLENQNGLAFSTRDKDNAGTNNRNCKHNSGWWLQSTICHRQPDFNTPYEDGVLHLHKYNTVQDRAGVSIKIRAKKLVS